MATRLLWKGAISFGLVHIPVGLASATRDEGIDFDWLDKRSMEPVGYKRINKATGKEIDKDDIVKGIEYQPGHYAVLSDDEIRAANPKATQTIDIAAFVPAAEVPFTYLETPYYLVPAARGEKVYALLRDTLLQTGKLGIATVVLHSKQRLAAIVPAGDLLIMNTLRWAGEVREADDLAEIDFSRAKPTPAEKKMAVELVESMAAHFKPDDYRDTFRDDIMALVDRKVEAGKTAEVARIEPHDEDAPTAEIIDLTALLKKSLRNRIKPDATAGKPRATRGKSDAKAKSESKSDPQPEPDADAEDEGKQHARRKKA